MNRPEIETLLRRIAPADFASHPIYVCFASIVPTHLRPSALCWGFTAPALDLAFHEWLVSCGRWRGRGPVIVLNDIAIRAEAEALAGDDHEFADQLYRSRILATALHEAGHVLQCQIDLRPIPEDIAFDVEHRAQDAVAEFVANEDTPPVPWKGHDAEFIRVLIHVVNRAEQILGERLPARLLFDHGRFDVSTLFCYRRAIEREIVAFDSTMTFADLRLCHPPDAFVDLWKQDLHDWLERQTAEDDSAVLSIAAAMAPYIRITDAS